MAKPKGGVSFITDFDRRDILAITHQGNPADGKDQGAIKPAAMAMDAAPAKKAT